MATNNQIKFIQLTQAKYNDILSSSATVSSSIYFTSDTGRIYKGNQLFTKDFLIVNAVPEAANMEKDRLYVVSTTGDMYILQDNQRKQVGGQSSSMNQVKSAVSSNYSAISSLSNSFEKYVNDFNTYSSTTSVTLSTLSSNISSNTDDIGVLRGSLNGLTSSSVVTVDSNATVTDGYLKTYQIKQGGVSIGKIDIPKDLVVKSGSVVVAGDGTNNTTVITGATAGDKYIELIIQNKENTPIYIAVKDLVDAYTAQQNAAVVQLNIDSNNEISATIVDGSIESSMLALGVQNSLSRADSALQSGTTYYTDIKTEANGDTLAVDMNSVKSRITTLETFNTSSLSSVIDGRIDAKFSSYNLESGSTNGTVSWNGNDIAVTGLGSAAFTDSTAYDASGSAETVQNTLTGESTDSITALTLNGLSNRITSVSNSLGTDVSTALSSAITYTDNSLAWQVIND